MSDTDQVPPYRIRFMAEVGCGFALWGDPRRPCPVNGEYEADDLEHLLPISEDLRARILAWADRNCRYDGGVRDLDMREFDALGMHLSRELQRELGSAYTVHYYFTDAGARDKLLPAVSGEPCPGWTAS